MDRRHTIQREIVLKTVRRLHTHVTADDVYGAVRAEFPAVGRGTVYRNLNILAEEGEIRKIEVPGEADRFDFTIAAHYHVKCMTCKRISDVDMAAIPQLPDTIKDSRGGQVTLCDVAFTGICPECRKKNI